jgi:hypothetical protein
LPGHTKHLRDLGISTAFFTCTWRPEKHLWRGKAFGYTPAARITMWSLTLPQEAAILAATLVAFDTRNPAGQRLVDSRLLNEVLVLMVTTSILGPVLTEHFAPRLLKDAMPTDRMKTAGTP